MTRQGPGALGGRRESRERAVELAYEMRQREWTVDEIVASLVIEPEPFTLELLRTVEAERTKVDSLIADHSRWAIERMPVLDHVVAQLAVAEMLGGDTPTGVVLAEAVDLAGRYSTDDSARYVNGLLAAVSRTLASE